MKRSYIISTALLLNTFVVNAQDADLPYTVSEFTTELSSHWGLAFLPDGKSLVTQRAGELMLLAEDGKKIGPVTGLPSLKAVGQGGMLGIALHPDFAQNKQVYVCVNVAGDGGAGSEVHRGVLQGQQLVDVKEIFVAKPKLDTGYHFGCRISFDNNKLMYISLGDRGVGKEQAQDPTVHFGKVIRVNADGSIPDDNPFVGKSGADDVFTYGHRNVQGMTKHPQTGEMWTHEHGPRGGDEINILSSGDNYGWPKITYGINYDGSTITNETKMEGMRQPLTYWDPSIAPSGMTFYTGDAFAEWKGDLFVGSLKFRHLRRIELDENNTVVAQHELLKDRNERIRDVVQGPDGNLYVLVDNVKGKILKIAPSK